MPIKKLNNVVDIDLKSRLYKAAPTRLLVAGMGDALATYFEARASKRSNASTMVGAMATETANAMAELCYKTLLSDGQKAKLSSESKVSNTSLENIVEANTFLSGIGFESGGLGVAHAIHNHWYNPHDGVRAFLADTTNV